MGIKMDIFAPVEILWVEKIEVKFRVNELREM